MQKETLTELESIRCDLWTSSVENDLDLFQTTMDRFNDLLTILSAQEPANQADREGWACDNCVLLKHHRSSGKIFQL